MLMLLASTVIFFGFPSFSMLIVTRLELADKVFHWAGEVVIGAVVCTGVWTLCSFGIEVLLPPDFIGGCDVFVDDLDALLFAAGDGSLIPVFGLKETFDD